MIFFIFYFLGEEKEKRHGKYSNHFAFFFNTPKLDPKIDFRKKVNLYMSFSFLTGKIK